MIRRTLFAVTLAAAGGIAGPAHAADILTVYFHERPPYSFQQPDGSVHGILADIVDRAMGAAGIMYRWVELPSARQFEIIKRDEAGACGLGWFKRQDRETFAKFTTPLYRDLPTIAVARAGDARFAGKPTIDALFANKGLTLLVKTGYSYGTEIDAKIDALAPARRTDSSDNRIMLGIVSHQRVDYMLMSEEEAADLLHDPAFADAGLAIYHLADAPTGEYRYLMCSTSVPDATIERIDQALPAVQ